MIFISARRLALSLFGVGLLFSITIVLIILLPSAEVIIKTANEPISFTARIKLDLKLLKIAPHISAIPGLALPIDEYRRRDKTSKEEWTYDDRLVTQWA